MSVKCATIDGLMQLLVRLNDSGRTAPSRQFLLDFDDVRFLHGAMVGQLILLARKVKAAGGQLRLCNVNQEITAVFRIMKLDRIIEFQK